MSRTCMKSRKIIVGNRVRLMRTFPLPFQQQHFLYHFSINASSNYRFSVNVFMAD